MKKITLFFVSIAIVCLIVSWFNRQPQYQISPREKAMNTAIGRNIKFIKDKYKLIPFGTTISMPGGNIQYLELKFQAHGPLPKNIIRKMLIEIVDDFLTNLNNDAQLCAFLNKGKLDIKEVGIELFLIDQWGRGLDHPDIAIASITKGQLDFLTLADNEEHFRDFVLKEKESFEEALQILQSQRECTAVKKWCSDSPIK